MNATSYNKVTCSSGHEARRRKTAKRRNRTANATASRWKKGLDEDLEEECENAMGAGNVQVVNMNENNVKLGQAVDSRSVLLPLITAAAAQNLQMVRGMVNTFRMPVPVLQQILGLFSFKEIGILRRVHPHWNEIAGQLLNAAHSRLIQRAQHLLTDCQQRVTREPRMDQPVKLLNRLHVHALNPVDGMRAFMDEGVLYFPYGAFLDQAYSLLSRIDLMIENNYFDEEKQEQKADNLMDKLEEITKKAVLHYKQWIEPEAEKRMSELYRVSAQQRLQGIDSEDGFTSTGTEEEEAENDLNFYCALLEERIAASNQQLQQYSTPSTSTPHQILQPTITENANTAPLFLKTCFFCGFSFSWTVRSSHYNTSNCNISSFYCSNNWSKYFNEINEYSDVQQFDFSVDPGQHLVYLVRDEISIMGWKYIGITTIIKKRFVQHRYKGTFNNLQNAEYGILIQNISEKNAKLLGKNFTFFLNQDFLEGSLILSTRIGNNLINRKYEFDNIVQALKISKEEEVKEKIIEFHKAAIHLLKNRWNKIEWIKWIY